MKKFALRAIAVVVGLIVLNVALRHVSPSFDLGSHLYTAFSKATWKAKKSVPLQWEIDRLRLELAKIEPDMKHNFGVIADEMVAVENLKKEIADGHTALEGKKKELLTMKADLETGSKYIVYGGREHPADAVRDKLSHDFEAYKIADAGLKKKEELLTKKEASLEAAKQQIEAMRASKAQLENELESLQTELRLVQLTETKSKVQIDDSRLTRIKESMKDIHDRIESHKKVLALEQQFADNKVIDVASKVKSNEVVKDMDEYFGKGDDNKVVDKK